MPIIIHTGDTEKCVTYNYIECPACGERFDLPTGRYLQSATLGGRVLVCLAHVALTVENEIHIQESLQKAIDSPRGMVQKGTKFLKTSDSLKNLCNHDWSKP